MIDSSTMSTLIFILKKVHRFLQYEMEEKKNDWCARCKQQKNKKTIKTKKVYRIIDSYNRKEKNDWCAHCKPKKVKKVHKFLQYERKRNNWCACCKQKKQRK